MNRKSPVAFLFALLLMLTLCACGKSTPAPAPEPTPAPIAEPTPASAAEPTPAPTAEPTPAPAAEPAGTQTAGRAPGLIFTTTDRAGNTVEESVFAGKKLTMINFWEPWCPPCVREMPDLAKLYDKYRDEGFLILGVYATEDQESSVDKVLSDAGTTYPILHYVKVFDKFQTGYVPTTVFLDENGDQIGEVLVGSRSAEEWEALILKYMN